MSQRTVDICDLCLVDGQETLASHCRVPIKIGSVRGRALDLCEQHYEGLSPYLRALGQAASRPVSNRRPRDAQRRAQGPFKCKVPGCGAPPLKHTGTLWQHLRRVHNSMTMAEYKAKYGELVPLSPEEQAAFVAEARCEEEECGEVYSTELGHRWPHAALVTHMWGRHGIKVNQGGK